MTEIATEVWRLVQDQRGQDVIVLRDERGRHLAIWIGPCEAFAISAKMLGPQAATVQRRPFTHDLCATIIERLGGAVESVVIDDFANDIYYAKIRVAVEGGEMAIDSRPSDAIALALRCGAPVLVEDQLLEEREIIIADDSPPADAETESPPEDTEAE